jgi:uncharacterized RDD family membrane protein YckC
MYSLQKANVWRRFSAYLFDIIILFIIIVGVASLLSVVLKYDTYNNRLNELEEQYLNEYDVDLSIKYDELTDEQKAAYDAKYEAADKAFGKDPEVIYNYQMVYNLMILIVTFSILIAYVVVEFIVPLLFKNGQTLGKKIFGIGVMRVDGIKVTPLILFVRSILGKFTIETMIPVLMVLMIYFGAIGMVGVIVIALIFIFNLAILIATKTNSAIHDAISQTVTVDMSTQLIFDTPEQLLEYKQRIHADEAAKAQY